VNPHIRTITDALMMVMLLVLAEQEAAAFQWRQGALSCFAKVRTANRLFDATINPLTTPEQVQAWRPLDAAR